MQRISITCITKSEKFDSTNHLVIRQSLRRKKNKIFFIYDLSIKFVRFCHHCGQPLSLSIEIFCPNSGFELDQVSSNENKIDINKSKDDVIAHGFSDHGNLYGKEIHYTQKDLFLISRSQATYQTKF